MLFKLALIENCLTFVELFVKVSLNFPGERLYYFTKHQFNLDQNQPVHEFTH